MQDTNLKKMYFSRSSDFLTVPLVFERIFYIKVLYNNTIHLVYIVNLKLQFKTSDDFVPALLK